MISSWDTPAGTAYREAVAERDEALAELAELRAERVIPATDLRTKLAELRSEYDDTPGQMWNGALDAVAAWLDEYTAEASSGGQE